MPKIPDNGTLQEYQAYIHDALEKRGFLHQDINTRLALLVEEIGELAKAIRKFNNEKIDINSKVTNLSEELADVFFVLLSIANKCDVNISEAFIDKEEKNNTRIWK